MTPTAPTPARFKVGDPVRIKRPHPWHGHTGRITQALDLQGLDWIVRLDGLDHWAGVSNGDIRKAVTR
jgi:hypothetical protein